MITQPIGFLNRNFMVINFILMIKIQEEMKKILKENKLEEAVKFLKSIKIDKESDKDRIRCQINLSLIKCYFLLEDFENCALLSKEYLNNSLKTNNGLYSDLKIVMSYLLNSLCLLGRL